MELGFWSALVAGFVATLVMTAMIAMSRAAGMTQMPSFEIMNGSMLSGDEKTARLAGAFIHYVMMGTIVFGLGYAFLYSALDSATWITGLAIGIVHGLVVGILFMPMMPAMHPRMTPAGADAPSAGEVQLTAPGVMGKNWGAMTPAGVLMGHAVYGLMHASLYAALI